MKRCAFIVAYLILYASFVHSILRLPPHKNCHCHCHGEMYYTNSLTNFTTTSLLIASFFSYPPPEERYDYAKRLKLAIAELQKVGILTIL